MIQSDGKIVLHSNQGIVEKVLQASAALARGGQTGL